MRMRDATAWPAIGPQEYLSQTLARKDKEINAAKKQRTRTLGIAAGPGPVAEALHKQELRAQRLHLLLDRHARVKPTRGGGGVWVCVGVWVCGWVGVCVCVCVCVHAGLPGMRAVVMRMSISLHCFANSAISASMSSLVISVVCMCVCLFVCLFVLFAYTKRERSERERVRGVSVKMPVR